MRRSIDGPFSIERLAPQLWRLTSAASPPAELYLRLAPSNAAALTDRDRTQLNVPQLEVHWRREGVRVTLMGRGGAMIEAHSVFIHEPKFSLYEALPLAKFDAGARRFWRRVFFLLKLPGGRSLLKVIARRTR